MVYNCGYPIWHTFYAEPTDVISYSIYVGTTELFRGQVIPYDITATTCRVDISPVCRKYMAAFYEDIPEGDIISALVPAKNNISTLQTFRVVSSFNSTQESPDVEYTVIYDYNTDYVSVREDIGNRNNPILLEADPRQFIGLTGYATVGSTTYGWRKNNGAATNYPSLGTRYQVLALRLNSATVNAKEGDTITLTQGTNGNIALYTYKVVKPCKNRFVLYYVNKLGGIDSLLCSGQYKKKWNTTDTNARLYDDRGNRRDFQQTRLFSQIAQRWELNTGWMDENKAEMIDEVIYSPKCWIHDLDKNTITACLITDTSYEAKRFDLNDTPAQYTINVEESQLYDRA